MMYSIASLQFSVEIKVFQSSHKPIDCIISIDEFCKSAFLVSNLTFLTVISSLSFYPSAYFLAFDCAFSYHFGCGTCPPTSI